MEEPYKLLNVKNQVVIDIGAYNGDTAIYFSKKGAKQIFAFEPFPFSYQIAKYNLRINNIGNVTLLNEGISTEDSVVIIDPAFESNIGSSVTQIFSHGKLVKLNSLQTVVQRFNLQTAVLKMDCEGCENALLNCDENVLRVFDEILVEYHYGLNQCILLANQLRKHGYNIIFLDQKGNAVKSPELPIGMIYARL